jgi:DNA-binding MarR family transcriptional regulator
MSAPNDSLGFLLVEVSRLMRRAFKEKIEGSCLTHAQARALVHVSRNEGIRQVDLADRLEVQPITLARLLDQLGGLGLIERRADPNDRRVYRIHLKKGAAPHLAAIQQVAGQIERAAFAGLGAKQSTDVFRALSRMRDNLGSK